jgi:hypothetical protein
MSAINLERLLIHEHTSCSSLFPSQIASLVGASLLYEPDEVQDSEAPTAPFRTSRDILRALHVLRC